MASWHTIGALAGRGAAGRRPAAARDGPMVDDSQVAIDQARSTIEQLGITVHVKQNGAQALRQLQQWRDDGIDVTAKLLMVVTDAEMPEMDGYRLTTEIRKDPALKDLYVVLHTSLSGDFNKSMTEKVGCNDFLSKFQPDQLAMTVQNRIRDKLKQ